MHAFYQDHGLSWIGPELDAGASTELQRIVATEVLLDAQKLLLQGAARFDQGFQGLSSGSRLLAEIDDDRLMQVTLHPSFRYLLKALHRVGANGGIETWLEYARHVIDFVWPELAAAERLSVGLSAYTDSRGGLRCVTRGLFLELGEAYANQRVDLVPSEGGVTAVCEDGLTFVVPYGDLVGSADEEPPNIEQHGYALTRFPTIADERIQVSSRDPWLRAKLSGTNQRRDGVEFFGVDDETYPSDPSLDRLADALARVQEVWPEAYDDISQFTKVILIANFGQHQYRAFTVSSRQGAIFLGSAPRNDTIEMLLHENAHVKLRQMQVLDPLLEDPSDDALRFSVPWRPDPRPMPGIVEGLFVFTHVAEYELRELQRGTNNSADLLRRLTHLRHAANLVEKHAKLTAAGALFAQQMREWIESIRRRAIAC